MTCLDLTTGQIGCAKVSSAVAGTSPLAPPPTAVSVKFNFTTSYTLSNGFAVGQIKSDSLKKVQRKKK